MVDFIAAATTCVRELHTTTKLGPGGDGNNTASMLDAATITWMDSENRRIFLMLGAFAVAVRSTQFSEECYGTPWLEYPVHIERGSTIIYSDSRPIHPWNDHPNFIYPNHKTCSQQFRTHSRQFRILSRHQFFQFHAPGNNPAIFILPSKIRYTFFPSKTSRCYFGRKRDCEWFLWNPTWCMCAKWHYILAEAV